jgi:hypothetical protein
VGGLNAFGRMACWSCGWGESVYAGGGVGVLEVESDIIAVLSGCKNINCGGCSTLQRCNVQ